MWRLPHRGVPCFTMKSHPNKSSSRPRPLCWRTRPSLSSSAHTTPSTFKSADHFSISETSPQSRAIPSSPPPPPLLPRSLSGSTVGSRLGTAAFGHTLELLMCSRLSPSSIIDWVTLDSLSSATTATSWDAWWPLASSRSLPLQRIAPSRSALRTVSGIATPSSSLPLLLPIAHTNLLPSNDSSSSLFDNHPHTLFLRPFSLIHLNHYLMLKVASHLLGQLLYINHIFSLLGQEFRKRKHYKGAQNHSPELMNKSDFPISDCFWVLLHRTW
jgi:hypothetical protein